jgi:hypothetical protein
MCSTLIGQIVRQVLSGDLSDEACSDIDLSSGELAKSEVALQDSLGRNRSTISGEAAIQDSLAHRARWWHKKSINTEGAFQGGSGTWIS